MLTKMCSWRILLGLLSIAIVACGNGSDPIAGDDIDASMAGSLGGHAGSPAVDASSNASSCHLTTGKSACDTCVLTHCSSSCSACEVKAECLGLLQCVGNCTQDVVKCETECESTYLDGVQVAMDLAGQNGCIAIKCGTACAGGEECQLSSANAACDECIQNGCRSQCASCQNSQECLTVLDCFSTCDQSDAQCFQSCEDRYPNGMSILAVLAGADGCMMTTCATACGTTSSDAGSGGQTDAGAYSLPESCVQAGVLAGAVTCNPLTNEGCTSGEACDIGVDSQGGLGFLCFLADVGKEGDACDNDVGPWCQAKLRCLVDWDGGPGKCAAMCCTDRDCTGRATKCAAADSRIGTFGMCE